MLEPGEASPVTTEAQKVGPSHHHAVMNTIGKVL